MNKISFRMLDAIKGLMMAALLAAPLIGCSDSLDGDDPEEPFVDPYPMDKLPTDSTMCTNPVIYSDVPDPSIVRVGNDYYMVSTTFALVPGAPILHSTDLVGWEIVSYVIPRFEDTPTMDFERDGDRDDAYAQGMWAASLNYHNGKFYCLWNNYGKGRSFISCATKAEGPWEVVKAYDRMYYDSSLFFDEDGTPYIVAAWDNTIYQLDSNLSETGNSYPFSLGGHSAEGYHMMKHDGYYYIYAMTWPQPQPRSVLCLRSQSIEGPWETNVILSAILGNSMGDGVSQGTVIDTPDGRWYGLFFTDMGAVGRTPVLTTCHWGDNGWPVLGTEGTVPLSITTPVQTAFTSTSTVVKSDDFASDKLDLIWQWNHNPDNQAWSLTARSGYLRLSTPAVATDFYHAKNTLTCRTMGPACVGSISMNIGNMLDGDFAGLAMMQYFSGMVGVKREGSIFKVYQAEETQNASDRKENESVTISSQTATIELKVLADFSTNQATFHYRLPGGQWTKIGSSLNMVFDLANFVGNRFAIFNYATKKTGGYVDVDYFNFKRQ